MDILFINMGVIPLTLVFFSIFAIKLQDSESWTILFFSIVLIGTSILHFHYSGTMESLMEIWIKNDQMGKDQISSAKSALTIWNFLIPLLTGGLGVNMLNTWVTSSKQKSLNERNQVELLLNEIESLRSALMKLENWDKSLKSESSKYSSKYKFKKSK